MSGGTGAAGKTLSPEEKRRLLAQLLQKKAVRATRFPLSFAQQRLWFLHRLEPDSPLYNIPATLRLEGPLDVEALERALAEIVRRHEALRTVFTAEDGEPVQVVQPASGFVLRREPLADGGGDPAERVRDAVRLEAARPFDLAAGPLFRATLFRVSGEEHVLVLNMHHVVSDGWSLGVLFGELAALYDAFRRGEPSPLPPLPIQYADFAVWQREHLRGAALEAQLAFWKEHLAGAPPVLELPTDRPRPAVQSHRGALVPFAVDAGPAQALQKLGRSEGATLFMVLLAAFQVLLSRWARQDDVVVGTPIAGRTRPETEGLIGFFVNTLALRSDLSGDPTFRELLARVRQTMVAAQAHQDLPFERLVEVLHVERSPGHSPVFQVLLATHGPAAPLEFGGVRATLFGADTDTAKFDLSLVVQESGAGLECVLEYATALFKAATIERMAEHLRTLLQAVAADPGRRVSELPLMGDAERTQLVAQWSRSGDPAGPASTVHALFAEQAARTPAAVALVCRGERLSYAELESRANRLAHHLRGLGVGPETRVGVCVERSPEMVVALLAVLKAGGAYVPLDPQYPAERLAYMLADCGAAVLLTQAGLRERFAGFTGAVVETPGTPLPPAPSPARGEGEHDDGTAQEALPRNGGGWRASSEPGGGVTPEHLAYVIYTSGSTGEPKGTEVPHRAIPGFFAGVEYARFDADQVLLQHSSTSWDALTLELWPALLTGGTCVLYPGQGSEPGEVGRQVREHGVTTLWLTSAYFNLIVDTCPEILAGVRQVMVGGDAVSLLHVRRAQEIHPELRLVNGYGPSECTVFSTCYPIPQGFGAATLPIGRPIGDRRVYLLNRGFAPVPVGVPGELCVGGPGVARGYRNRPELTAEKFIPDPFSGEAGARLYRTGDLARWRADGLLEFMGRVDFQVKIRGFRVEPGEVEGVLGGHPDVREAVVVVRETAPGEKRLVAYVTGEEGAEPTPAGLRSWLGERLPDYMVPAAVVVLDSMPLTANGKVDRRALPDPEWSGGEDAYVAPRTETEALLCGIWAEVLKIERVGVEEDFFDLGGHSLLATQVVARAQAALGVEVPLRTLFEAPTVRRLAAWAEAALREGTGAQAAPLVPVSRDRPLPLSFAQQRLWFIDQLEPGSAAYNIPFPLRLRGALDVRALAGALTEIVRRHEALRTVFGEASGEPVQVIRPAAPFPLPVVDLGRLPVDAREAEARRLAAADAARPFDLARGPLLRAALLRIGDGESVLLGCMHHAVSDGWSMGIFARELSALYPAVAEGRPSPLPELPVQYADYAVWQRAWLSGETLERQLAYWRESLAGAPPLLELPTDRPRPQVQGAEGAAVPFTLPAETSAALRALARREGATPFMALLAAWQVLLARWSGQEDVVVGTPIAGRTRAETEGLIGLFVNTLVLRTDLGGDPGFRALLGQVRERVLGAYAHQEVPFEKLVEELAPERSLGRTPFFQVMLSLQNQEQGEPRIGPVEVEPLGTGGEAVKFDLNLGLAEHGGRYAGGLVYRAELFDAATAERMLEHFRVLLEGIAADPSRAVSDLPLLPPAERAQVLQAWNETARPFSDDVCLHELFARQAARTPERTALVFGDAETTYAELDARANRLAHALRRRGVGPETRVALYLEPSPEAVVALLGVMKAGGAYVPLDVAAPADRLAFLLEDSGAKLVLTTPALSDALPADGPPVLHVDAAAFVDEPATPPESGVEPRNLAYVIYTSGSTGRPKGVMVPHRGVCNTVENYVREYRVHPDARVLLFAPIHFDASLTDLFTPLCSGAALVVAPREALVPGPELVEFLERNRVTHAKFTPSFLAALPWAELPHLEAVMTGGEACTAEVVARWAPGRRFVNGYGPTETSVRVTAVECTDGARTPPIGPPVANARLYVLDARGELLPVGVPGELHIGGVGVTRGYLGRPDLTAAQFVPDPFSPEPGARMYRSGDRVRWLADGNLDFVGRVDFQVKIRGFRIEPGEVESALLSHPAVSDAVVVARGDGAGGKRLVGYVVPAAGREAPGAAELRAHLKAHLPEYMVPSAFAALDALPLTSNGKADRKALPEPDAAPGAEAYVGPRTPAEETLAAIWAETLRVERVGVEDDFFALGGHSLVATRVISRVREAFGAEVPLRALFEAPTVAGLAERVEALLRAGAGVAAPPVVPVLRDGPLPLSFAQQRLWFLDRLQPGSSAYNVPAALRLRGPLEVDALRRAYAELERRHETLRTVFREHAGEPVQVIREPGPAVLPTVDLANLPAEAREDALRRLAAAEARRPFDLAEGPLFRRTLVALGGAEWALLFSLHHAVSDGWSTGVLVRELSALYDAFSRGEPSPLAPLPVQYGDYAVWQRAWLTGDTLERQLAYWRERLAGVPPLLELPTDRPRPAVASDRGDARGFALSAETTAALRALARREGATLFAVLLAGSQALLARYAGVDDVAVGTPVAGRTRLETEGLIGFFVNTLVLRTDLSGELTGSELIRRVRERVLEAHAHQDVPFERLVEELRVERSLAQTPLFQAMFVLDTGESDRGALRLGDVDARPLGADLGTEKFDLTLGVTDTGEQLQGGISYRTDLWDGETVERMLGHLTALLEGLAATPERPVAALPLLGAVEKKQVLEEWNATERPYPAGLRVHDLFHAQVARTPEAVAVSWRGERLTYAELDRRANRLAHTLRRRGVGPEVRVGICMTRTPELLVALLAVLKAGGAYVPLDPAYPQERLGYMVEDAGISLVLTESRLTERLPEGADVLVLDREQETIGRESDEAPESGTLPENLSHVIFTSGSTGRPKGVMIRHSSTVVLLHWMRENVTDTERSSVLFSTSINFDVSVAEIFGTLCWGGKLVLVENALELPDVQEEIVYASMVPSAAAELLRTGGIPASVRTLNLGGEALPNPLAQALCALGTVERVGNLYGPTEDTTYSTYSLVERGSDLVFVGRPVANTRAYILDAQLQPVPIGVIGELYLAGDGLARGYASRPDLTAERFVPNPFGPAGSRMYRVMDRVRYRTDGVIEYFGRTDFQVKVRGFRIELGEIEAVLARHPTVREAVATVREDVPGDRRIVAYVTTRDGAEVSPAELRAEVGAHLPEYMVPSAVVVLESFPQTPNGKTDRRALPAPEWAEGAREGEYTAPRDALELTLARIWEEVLGTSPVGVRDDFFALGGHSLLAVRLMSQVERATGVHLPLATLFTAPTIERLAAVLRREETESDGSTLVPIRPGGTRTPLFLVHPVGGNVLAYAALTRHLDVDQPVYGLRSRGLVPGEAPHTTVEEMAADYLVAIRAVQPVGPYRLGGWSMGGVIAFEMARQLERTGEHVETLVLIDSHLPALHGLTLPADPKVRVRTFALDLGLPPERLTPTDAESGEEPVSIHRVLEGARAAGIVPPDLTEEHVERLYGVFESNLAALYAYQPEGCAGAVSLLRATEHDPRQTESAGWERIARGGVRVHRVPGSHFTLVREPQAAALARALERCLAPADLEPVQDGGVPAFAGAGGGDIG
jgi:amino acid adenylation domain-containing protein